MTCNNPDKRTESYSQNQELKILRVLSISIIQVILILFSLKGISQTFEKAATKFITTGDGVKLQYRIIGNAKDTLIFLHGGPGQNCLGVAPDLEPLSKDHVFIIYDQRGCGGSDLGDTSMITASQHVEDLETLRKFFSIEKLKLVGHSWGCMLAALYVNKYPTRVGKLLLLSPGPPTRKLFQERFASFAAKDSLNQPIVAKLRQQLETADDPVSICNQIREINERFYYFDPKNSLKKKGNYCAVSGEAIRKQAITARLTLRSLGDYDLIPLISKITQAALIIEGAQTPVPLKELETWVKSLPNGKLLLIQSSGHGYPFVEQPEIFYSAVEKFLNSGTRR